MRSSSIVKRYPGASPPPERCQIIAPTEVAAYTPNWLVTICKQLSRYSIISALALSTDILIYMGLVYSGIRATLAGILGYTIGMVLNFVLSRHYVFDASLAGKSEGRLFSEFVISGVVGLALTASLIWIMTEMLHQGAAVAKLTAVGVSFLAVFILRRSVVFAPLGT
jgi:putative flippase GtrA